MEDYFFNFLPKKDLLVFVGKNIEIKKVPFLNLMPGDKIKQIGDACLGGMGTLNREHKFKPFITYVGIRKEHMHHSDKKDDVLMFEVRTEDLPTGIEPGDKMYIAFIVLYHDDIIELKLQNHQRGTFLIFKPIFYDYKG